jgi:hypothetical protein
MAETRDLSEESQKTLKEAVITLRGANPEFFPSAVK